MTTEVRFALAGAGALAGKIVKAFHKPVEGVRLSAIVSRNQQNAVTLARGIPDCTAMTMRAENYDSFDGVPLKASADFVVGLIPHGNRMKFGIAVMNLGLPVFLTKPTAVKVFHAMSLATHAAQRGLPFGTMYPQGYVPHIRWLKNAVAERRFGDVRSVSLKGHLWRAAEYYEEAPWRGICELDGGPLDNQLNHELHILVSTFGRVKVVLWAKSSQRHHKIEFADTIHALLQFESGILAEVYVTTAAQHTFEAAEITIIGSEGFAVLENNQVVHHSTALGAPADLPTVEAAVSHAASAGAISAGEFIAPILDFAAQVRGEKQAEACLGPHLVAVCRAIDLSAQEKRAVELPLNSEPVIKPLGEKSYSGVSGM